MKLSLKINQLIFWLRFVFSTWRTPNHYREICKRISSCYLTPQAPGTELVGETHVSCITSTPLMVMVIENSGTFYIDRINLMIKRRIDKPDVLFPFWDRRAKAVRQIFKHISKCGMPFKMSNTQVKETGL